MCDKLKTLIEVEKQVIKDPEVFLVQEQSLCDIWNWAGQTRVES